MKIRQGFVSNSSSSSFVIRLKDLTGQQLEQIRNHAEVAKEDRERFAPCRWCDEPWSIDVTDRDIRGATNMDNFDMREFLRIIGVPMDKVGWDGDNRLGCDRLMAVTKTMDKLRSQGRTIK